MYDFRELPLLTAARLACGLSADSRAWRKIRGEELRFGEQMTVSILMVLAQIRFYAARGVGYKAEFPKALYGKLTGANSEKKTDGFDSADDFERMRARILKNTGR